MKEDENQDANKKQKTDSKNKEDLLRYVENQELSSKRQEQLKNGMCLAGFEISSSKTLAGRIFNNQLIKVEAKIENELQTKSNITLAFGNSENSCRQLLGQFVSYKENEPPFNDPFESDYQIPQTW
ncbi:12525_t:CDS:2 [Racocetra fulgida]|uniref:12525_t:CDS:1 n=1 Tax=Racocetra fulgida TaxID=60492 RepID=A0A9N8YZ26_9GLOM|nr:12525_t:CDS:2 [Racocetra fulgida]